MVSSYMYWCRVVGRGHSMSIEFEAEGYIGNIYRQKAD